MNGVRRAERKLSRIEQPVKVGGKEQTTLAKKGSNENYNVKTVFSLLLVTHVPSSIKSEIIENDK